MTTNKNTDAKRKPTPKAEIDVTEIYARFNARTPATPKVDDADDNDE